ncbi:hypothetical protein BU23DRAFT_31269 [Bimuria novae-zelandiae CBS 107.79]|uniref:Uncharacterized protein n=1 Tax=Bimuria novae-zelandiae CBS 107.79 TaxID=1447943 RepID=A0A6A5VLR7_9PLEO|nr:hypothetical protein BU23DRAFT_31269 [Bimuria novae-zelandiae CBS 107.79]
MAEHPANKLFGFHCCPDPAIGEPVDDFRKNGVRGLMTDHGLEFIKTYVRDNDVIRGSLESDNTTWHLAFLEAMYQRPGCAVCWLGKWPLKARVFLLLGRGSKILLYNGSESLDREKDEFDMYMIPEAILKAKIEDKSIGRCEMRLEDGGVLAYDGRMAYDLVKGSLFVFGFVPEEISDKFAKGREKLVLPQSLKDKADELSTSRTKFIFRLV